MNVTCSHCGAVFRVDPEKVPAEGVSARCSQCSGVFRIEREPDAGGSPEVRSPEPATPRGIGDGPEAAVSDDATSREVPRAETPDGRATASGPDAAPRPAQVERPDAPTPTRPPAGPPAAPVPEPAAPAAPPAPAAPRSGPTAATGKPSPAPSGDAGRRPASPFGAADPKARARRLARALVSDIVVYHPERRDRSRQNGTLRQEFREEIRKSWEEYVAQVGPELARGTPYFREALNELLAGGDRVF